jgi:ferritin-like protein
VTAEFTRAELFSRGAKGGALLLGAGAAAVVLAPAAAADPLSDNDLAYVRLLVATELLGIDFYTRAIDAKKLSPTGQKYLKAALVNEKEHYQSVAGILSGANLVPAVSADIDFAYPKGSFDTASAVTKLAARLQATFLGAYLGAVGGMQASPLLGGIGRIAANQAQHLSVFQNMLFGRPINVSFPQAMSIQEVSNVMDGFTA